MAVKREKAEAIESADVAPVVTLSTVNGTDVSAGGTANVSPDPPWLVAGTVVYPASLGVPRFTAQVNGTQTKTPTFGAPSGTNVITRTFTFNLDNTDILSNGDPTLIVEANNTTLSGGGILGGVGADDAPIHASGFGTTPPPPPPSSPTPPPPPSPPVI